MPRGSFLWATCSSPSGHAAVAVTLTKQLSTHDAGDHKEIYVYEKQ
jgi:hypothetical protein